ncbi:MAG: hypothetical protein AABZ06_07635 [Bdellovibrionota bacterium]
MLTRERKIILLHMMAEGPVSQEYVDFGGICFNITEHKIGWDFVTAEALIKKYDGYADGIAVSGVQKRLAAGNTSFMHPGYLFLLRAAVRTPFYMADDVRDFFSDWTLHRILKEQPKMFQGRNVLFHSAAVSPCLEKITNAGARVASADMLLLSGLPVLLKGTKQIETYVKLLRLTAYALKLGAIGPDTYIFKTRVKERFAKWVRASDVFVTFGNLLDLMDDLSILKEKIVIADYLSAETRRRIAAVKTTQIIEFIPDNTAIGSLQSRHFSLLTTMLDQKRISEDSPLSFDEYVLKWVQEQNVYPNRLRSSAGIARRCAFVIHPLVQSQLWKSRGMSAFEKAPAAVKDWVESKAGLLPVFRYGTLKGAISQKTGQEVICDIYAYCATPKQLLSLDEDLIYNRIVQAAEQAMRRGAGILGLGAYTKVVGDAGVTIAKRSPIPVTNGNSYSASTTLWAARVMVEKLGLVKPVVNSQNRMRAKAMVIGATGSIGRVSSLLVSLVVDELVLVATRPDKLLELRQEVLELSPNITVRVTTNPNPELRDTDLVVTATSNQGGEILDIEQVKPGAVICDCSRPLDIGRDAAAKRPDVLVIESGEVLLPGNVELDCDIGLPKPAVYACLAETVLLAMEGRLESFSLSKQLSMEKVKEIYKIGIKHGATLSAIQGPNGVIADEDIVACRKLALKRLKNWKSSKGAS